MSGGLPSAVPPGGMDELVEAYKHLLACVAKKVWPATLSGAATGLA